MYQCQEGRDLVQHAIRVEYGKTVILAENAGDRNEEEEEVVEADYHEDDDHFDDIVNYNKSSVARFDPIINKSISNNVDESVKSNFKRPRASSKNLDDDQSDMLDQKADFEPEPHITHKQKRLMKKQKALEEAVLSPDLNSNAANSLVQDPFFNEIVVVTKDTLTGKVDAKNKNPNRCYI